MKILVVEDHPADSKLASVVLVSAGNVVTVVIKAEHALAAIERDPPDVILMDLELPSMHGLELVRRLKRDPIAARIPVMAVTAYPARWGHRDAIAAGCNAYVVKPLDTRLLPQQLSALVAGESKA